MYKLGLGEAVQASLGPAERCHDDGLNRLAFGRLTIIKEVAMKLHMAAIALSFVAASALLLPVGAQARGGGYRGGGFHGGGYHGAYAGRHHDTAYHRSTAYVGRNGGTVVHRSTAYIGRRGNVAVRSATVVRPGGGAWVRPSNYWWRPGGAIAAGAAIGFVTAATAVAWAGAAPGPNMCWYYTDPSQRTGFWDTCQ